MDDELITNNGKLNRRHLHRTAMQLRV